MPLTEQSRRPESMIQSAINRILTLLVQLGVLTDEGLNVATGGAANQTLSMRTATAARSGDRWACVLCNLLSILIQPRHCAKQLSGEPMNPWNYLRAAACIFAIYGGIAGLILYASHKFI